VITGFHLQDDSASCPVMILGMKFFAASTSRGCLFPGSLCLLNTYNEKNCYGTANLSSEFIAELLYQGK
jgi:hypothetical protein